MNLHYFQHVEYEGLDRIQAWATQRGHSLSVTRFFAKDPLPRLEAVDFLLIMGGPMGVYEEAKYPWMTAEKRFIKEAMAAGKKVLGICLGAQLIASAMGARVYPNKQKEIGWWMVRFLPSAKTTPCAAFGEQAMLYHWHADTFDLPAKATLLASSDACRHQAFALGQNVLALQFHPEISAETIERWVQESSSVKTPQGFVMGVEAMQRLAPRYLPTLEKSLYEFLDTWTNQAIKTS